MATPRRTSARIRARTPGKTPEPINILGSLIERDETPSYEQSLNAAVASSDRSPHIPGAFESDSFLITPPAPTGADADNMHPSKIQQSTTREADESLMLGFSSIKNTNRPAAIEDTPSKSKICSPGFEFKFANADKHLTAETQRIMDSVREEAARIKEQMRRERDEQTQNDTEGGVDISGRKIAHPKGRSGRFSDAHQAQFSKMESIANHPSMLKHKQPVLIAGTSSPRNLKRTQSKASLSDERIENTSPSKRAKASGGDDVSAARPISRDGSCIPLPAKLPSAATTPTKASLARSASVKSLRNPTQLSGLLRSKSTKDVTRSRANINESTTRSLFGLKKSISVKSILSRPQPKYSDDPLKIAAGTHLPLQEQPSGTPVKAIKHVGFAEDLTSPTLTRSSGIRMPTKVLTPYRKSVAPSSVDVFELSFKPAETTPTGSMKGRREQQGVTTPLRASPLRAVASMVSEIKSDPIVVSSPTPRRTIAPSSCSKISTGINTIEYPRLNPLGSNPPKPGDFTFRADRQIKFGPSQTIRPVRPSGIPTTIAPFAGLPSVPHGMSNKKRARTEVDEDEERENHPPAATDGSPSKKLRVSIGQDVKSSPAQHRHAAGKFRPTPTPGNGKRKLSLSRLNFLARPKHRA